MLTVALPKKIEYQKSDEPNRGTITIEPCFPGYGVTLGNSIRRVLLSSLPGAAVVGVKIDGVSHEFMALSHLKEDILEFIMNLKKLRLQVFSDEIEKLELEVHGKKEVTAGDIKKNSNVEIANPELPLGSIVDMAGKMRADIYVKKGMGYEMIENRDNKEKETNYIEIDSIFSPVIAVGIKVENVRVGKQTNYDKLILDIKTDGTITPEAGFQQAIDILLGQFQSLVIEDKADAEAKEEIDESEEDYDSEEEEESENNEEGYDQAKKKRGRPKKNE